MTESAEKRVGRPTDAERHELNHLMETFRQTAPRGSRRDFMRWTAIGAGALATARFGFSSAEASPNGGRGLSTRFQDDEIETDATITVPLDPFGQAVTLDPHRTVNWGPFWHPNGRHIIYATSVHGHANYELYIMRADGTRKTRLTFTPGADVLPALSPDAKYLMWSSKRTEDNSTQLFLAEFRMPRGM